MNTSSLIRTQQFASVLYTILNDPNDTLNFVQKIMERLTNYDALIKKIKNKLIDLNTLYKTIIYQLWCSGYTLLVTAIPLVIQNYPNFYYSFLNIFVSSDILASSLLYFTPVRLLQSHTCMCISDSIVYGNEKDENNNNRNNTLREKTSNFINSTSTDLTNKYIPQINNSDDYFRPFLISFIFRLLCYLLPFIFTPIPIPIPIDPSLIPIKV